MEIFIRYILISTFCLSVLYLGYLVFQKGETRLQQLRYFLLFSVFLSILLPLSTYRIDLKLSTNISEIVEINQIAGNTEIKTDGFILNQSDIQPIKDRNWNIKNFLIAFYLIGLSFLLCRLLVHLIKIFYLFGTTEKIKQDNIVILNSRIGSPFTFFNWIFIPNDFLIDENKDIITHERVHASQYHSIDLILIELLSAVMWFNPLVWMMKNSVQLVHEYLADEGVLNTGTDKHRYQALLLNQVAEETLICLSSSFNPVCRSGWHSLIKKRIIMMTKSKFNQGSKLRILALIPLATVLFIAIACVNGQTKTDKSNYSITPKVNYLYKWAYNPLSVNLPPDSKLQTNNGKISNEGGEIFVIPDKEGLLKVSSFANGTDFSQEFTVVPLPNPKFVIGGEILNLGNRTSIDKLIKNRELHVYYGEKLEATYDVSEYRIYFNQDKSDEEKFVISGNKISDKEIELIKKGLHAGKDVVLDHLKLNFPDGKFMYHGMFKIEK
ncbi:MAG: hypothetical protein JXB00_20080 [Bacteroidales bacterium]|nr:hypothetical protein [Bacteroidales bacterium]